METTKKSFGKVTTAKPKVAGRVFAPIRDKGRGYLFDRKTITNEVEEGKSYSVPLDIDTEFTKKRLLAFALTMLAAHLDGTTELTDRELEYVTTILDREDLHHGKRLTTQVKGIEQTEGVIFTVEESKDIRPDLPVATSGFHPVDYLRHLGHDATIVRETDEMILKDLQTMEFVLYGHFLLAEAYRIADGQFLQDIETLFAEPEPLKPYMSALVMKRRLQAVTATVTKGGSFTADFAYLPWIVTVNGIEFRVTISLQDSSAVHGIASYADLAKNTGVTLTYKDTLNQLDKETMEEVMKYPTRFDGYSLGDLQVYQMLENNAAMYRELYISLGVGSYYQPPRLTIGATVRDIFVARLREHLDIKPGKEGDKEWKFILEHFIQPASAQALRLKGDRTGAMLAKIFGGRAFNNQPLTIKLGTPERILSEWEEYKPYVLSVIADIDISGCYGEGQRNQDYIIGLPEIIDFPANGDKNGRNAYMNLRDFIEFIKAEGVPGNWQATISTTEELSYSQDFFQSWFVSGKTSADVMTKHIQKALSDTDSEGGDLPEFDEKDGQTKVFHREIINGILTHDGLQIIEQLMSERQRNDFLDKTVVKTAMFYRKKNRVDGIKELLTGYHSHKGQNTSSIVDDKVTNVDGEYHGWMALNIGELLINDLLFLRKKAQKIHGKKSPQDIMYKLCVNTLYGDMTSKYFETANVVVGNNITARARALAYLMEKGLNGLQTITDGAAFLLNEVAYLNAKGHSMHELVEREQGKKVYEFRPIGGYEYITLDWTFLEATDKNGKTESGYYPSLSLGAEEKLEPYKVVKNGSEEVRVPALAWINQVAMEHLQNLFPGMDVVQSASTSLGVDVDDEGEYYPTFTPRKGQFEFEVKNYYESGVFHGTANYMLLNPNVAKSHTMMTREDREATLQPTMRSYETKKRHIDLAQCKGGLCSTGYYTMYESDGRILNSNPANRFMLELAFRPRKVRRQPPFIKERFVKPGRYKQHPDSFRRLGVKPGDTVYVSGLLRELSLSQFTYRTHAQYRAWEKAADTLKRKYGQSFEVYYINQDGTLNYQQMVTDLHKLIRDGVSKPSEVFDTNRNKSRRKNVSHPSQQLLDLTASKLRAEMDDSYEDDDTEYWMR